MYPGPADGDLREVRAINLRYLRHCRQRALRADTTSGPLAGLRGLGDPALERLAEVPFLLASLRENDAAYWSVMLDPGRSADLFQVRDGGNGAPELAIAIVAFAWQLCRRDPHMARLVAGAPPAWCDALLGVPFVELLDRCAGRAGLIVPRLADDGVFWRRLLTAGVAADLAVRRAAQLAALQRVLTRLPMAGQARLAAAACRLAPSAARPGPKPRPR